MKIINKYSLDSKTIMVNGVILAYFVTFALVNQLPFGLFFYLFYFALLLCAIAGMCSIKKERLQNVIILFLFLFSGIINYLVVGNASISFLFYLVLFWGVGNALNSKYLSEQMMLIVIILNIAIILYKILTVGLYGRFFISGTNNFVSVYLMYPTVVYYSIVAKNKSRIKMLPIIVIWVMTLLARGRGGIISVSVFLLMVYYLKYRSLHSRKRMIVNIVIFAVIVIITANLESIISVISSSIVMEQFNERGGLESSRTRFWGEYLKKTMLSFQNVMFGTSVSEMFIGRKLGGNPHNSLIEVHMFNGMVGGVTIIGLLFKQFFNNVNRKNYLFICCALFALLRGFTDHVLWNSYGTPILFFLLLYDETTNYERLKRTPQNVYKYSK